MMALKFIGLALLGGVILISLGLVLLIWFVRRWFRRALAADRVLPCRVTLEPEAQPRWRSASVVRVLIEELRALGFQDIGSFQAPEMGGLLLHALHHPREPAYAVVYDHQQLDPTMEIVRDFADGTGVNATNTALGGTLDQRPGVKTHWLGNVPARHLFDTVKQHAGSAPCRAHAAGDFAAHFQRSYAAGVNWRLKKGGVSREEIRRQAEKGGQTLTDEQLTEAWETQREKYRRQLQEGCIAQYLDDTRMPAAEWEKICDRAVALPETLELKEIVETLDPLLLLDTEQRHRLAGLTTSFGENGLDYAQRIVAQNPGGLGLAKLGEVTEPVRAWIVLVPDRIVPFPVAKAA